MQKLGHSTWSSNIVFDSIVSDVLKHESALFISFSHISRNTMYTYPKAEHKRGWYKVIFLLMWSLNVAEYAPWHDRKHPELQVTQVGDENTISEKNTICDKVCTLFPLSHLNCLCKSIDYNWQQVKNKNLQYSQKTELGNCCFKGN